MNAGAIRRFATAALAAAGIVSGMAAQAAEDPIKLGAVYIRSGSASSYGEFAEQGLRLAVEEINEKGGVLGRQLEYVIEDSQGNSGTAIQAMRKLVYQEEVDALMGLDSSGVAQGVASTIPQLRKPLIITHAATPDVTGKMCNDYVYRISVNIIQNMRGAAQIAAESGAKRWTTIGPDYAFGRQSWDYFSEALKQNNPDAELMSETAFPVPVFHGDTLSVVTTVESLRRSRSREHVGIVGFLHQAHNQHGTEVARCRRQAMMHCRSGQTA